MIDANFYRNIGSHALPCWVPIGDPAPDLSPLRTDQFRALLARHADRMRYDLLDPITDWLLDRGLDRVADGMRPLYREPWRLDEYVSALLTYDAGRRAAMEREQALVDEFFKNAAVAVRDHERRLADRAGSSATGKRRWWRMAVARIFNRGW